MLPRVALIAVAIAAIVFGASRLHRDDTCESTRSTIVAALFHHREPAGGLARQQRRLVANCRDNSVLAFVSTVETTAGHHALATALARRVTRAEPRNRIGWIALAQALQRSDPRGSAAAAARAKALDPRGAVPRGA
jgi:hypothetical protein